MICYGSVHSVIKKSNQKVKYVHVLSWEIVPVFFTNPFTLFLNLTIFSAFVSLINVLNWNEKKNDQDNTLFRKKDKKIFFLLHVSV